jgi:hypothetical protein
MAGPYKLKNGLVVKNVNFAAPQRNTSPAAHFENHTDVSRMPVLRFRSGEEDPSGTVVRVGFTISALVNCQGFSRQALQDNSVRLMQMVTIQNFTVEFAGRKRSDGFLSYSFSGGLKSLLLDCVTNPSATAAVNFPFYNNSPTTLTGHQYFAMLSDTPGFNSTTDERNTRTDRWNYLRRFRSEAEFLSYVVFVHRDGTREPLEGWTWTLSRLVELRFRQNRPQLFNVFTDLKPAASGTVLAPSDPRFVLMVTPGTTAVVNVLGNQAQLNFRNDSNVSFAEHDTWQGDVDEFFFV